MSGRFTAGEPVVLQAGVRRVLAPNPGAMTGPGTNTYLLGEKEIAVIDPGPALDPHLDAIQAAATGPIRWVLVTHTHLDHSPAAKPLAAATGAQLLGRAAPPGRSQEPGFVPDRSLDDGEEIGLGEHTLRAVHTPGHASNHLCYLLGTTGLLFTGDHVMQGSTVVINPPDGDMHAYLASLRRLKTLALTTLAPGHGETLDEPYAVIDWIIGHRLRREAKVVEKLGALPDCALDALVPRVYDDVDPALHAVAQRSLLAHLLKLEIDGRAVQRGARWRLV